MNFKKLPLGAYSLIILDILIIISIFTIAHVEEDTKIVIYSIIAWLLLAIRTKYYAVYRYTNWPKFLTQSFTQYIVFALFFLAYHDFFEKKNSDRFKLLITFLILVFIIKVIVFLVQKQFRTVGKDQKKIILFGNESSSILLKNLFSKRPDLGYQFQGYFSEKKSDSEHQLGELNDGFDYVLKEKIDEIYCDANHLKSKQVKKIREFATRNYLPLIFLPENNAIYSKDIELENIDTVPILKTKTLPFEKIETFITKRVFDILFSLLVLVLIFSWLFPIISILIKLDSKGPIFFKQKRDGKKGRQFYCFKFRSMKVNNEADKVSAKKNDDRVTKVGAYLRKTSLDELPQFINVLIGDMSVVGPRPHMNTHTKKYELEISNYMLRHQVKPGITGLAQISGYRGEIIKKSDILNRVRLDIFYIENWTFILDIKIIVKTLINVFIKEEKAY